MSAHYESNRPFLVIDTYHRPAPNARTSRKNWGSAPSEWVSLENPYLVDRITQKHRRTATVIIDLAHRTLIKSRFSDSPAEMVLDHYMAKYAQQVNEAMSIWLAHEARRASAA